MDALSEILSAVKLSSALYFNAEFSAPWGAVSPASHELAPLLAPGAPHLVIYHLVLEGEAFAHIGRRTVPLCAGDVVVVPHGDAHVMTSEPAAGETRESSAIARKVRSRELSPLYAGGGGRKTRFICGFMACDPELIRPILNGLPAIFKVNLRTDRSGLWLENAILHLVEEAGSSQVGCEAMMAKLSEALFIDTLRRHVATLPEEQLGWLTGARDPVVGKGLGLLHRRVSHPWTIAELAKEVGLSRSALVERFTRYLSEPPMTYLMRWRLQLAARALTHTSKGVAEVASDVGYESEAAFNRAFKREFGTPPARYRRERKSPPIAPILSRASD
ncbi:MAG: AraC family transcriptional regulator [Acidobacteriota bacterium]